MVCVESPPTEIAGVVLNSCGLFMCKSPLFTIVQVLRHQVVEVAEIGRWCKARWCLGSLCSDLQGRCVLQPRDHAELVDSLGGVLRCFDIDASAGRIVLLAGTVSKERGNDWASYGIE